MKIFDEQFRLIMCMTLVIGAGISDVRASTGGEYEAERTVQLPEFQLEVLDQSFKVTRGSLEGRFYMLYFWGTECRQCADDIQNLYNVYDAIGQDNFEILSISVDKDEEMVREYQQVFPMPWYHSVIGEDPQMLASISEKFEVENWPYAILITPEGEVINTFESIDEAKLESEIRSAMN